ncbi:hypothetical protein GLAREA_06220 [Glarea lozoyensis ATCC 20868]|uniref:Uncharacterized protein n=1 Tax=Glarea lozoyensis (strain ATCC 20868 / MF5171) TaxID=1116229 RepID=S3E447_GLAL2|nr:uncharacterized protein GLAREA_06220 [Glarea lozoyensis ATCC 20868]EPE33208.1 hypothetical protein GLAREA_06220 [Glarea lozoyensis ATCC 20868]
MPSNSKKNRANKASKESTPKPRIKKPQPPPKTYPSESEFWQSQLATETKEQEAARMAADLEVFRRVEFNAALAELEEEEKNGKFRYIVAAEAAIAAAKKRRKKNKIGAGIPLLICSWRGRWRKEKFDEPVIEHTALKRNFGVY